MSLVNFIQCKRLDTNLYQGQSKDLNTGQVYGGQVLSQAIKAASSTVESSKTIRSAHAYFLSKGDVAAPIIYEVDRSFDGGSISTRRVVAIQHGRQIFHLSASFQIEEVGFDFQNKKDVPLDFLYESLEKKTLAQGHFQSQFLDVCIIPDENKTEENSLQLWIKTKESLPDTIDIHNAVLAYISDMGLLVSTLLPHGFCPRTTELSKKLVLASIDHAMWFHRPFKVDEWFFYECCPISTQNGRGLAQGKLYNTEGSLFATTAQEGLIRLRKER